MSPYATRPKNELDGHPGSVVRGPEPIVGAPLEQGAIPHIYGPGSLNPDVDFLAAAAERYPGRWVPVTFDSYTRAKIARASTQTRDATKGKYDFRQEGPTIFIHKRSTEDIERVKAWQAERFRTKEEKRRRRGGG